MNQQSFEKIEEYLHGEMSDGERTQFRSELAIDSVLAGLFETYNFIDEEMRSENRLPAQLTGAKDDTAAFLRTLRSYDPDNFGVAAHPDQQYLDALLSNDSKLIAEIYAKYRGNVVGWVINNNGSEEDAEEMISIALINLLRRAKAGFVLTVPFNGIFYRECKWVWFHELKNDKKNSTKPFEDGENNHLAENPFLTKESQSEADTMLQRILSMLPRLAERHQKLIIMHFIQGKKVKVLTRLLNYTNDNTTRQALFKSIQKLKILLDSK